MSADRKVAALALAREEVEARGMIWRPDQAQVLWRPWGYVVRCNKRLRGAQVTVMVNRSATRVVSLRAPGRTRGKAN